MADEDVQSTEYDDGSGHFQNINTPYSVGRYHFESNQVVVCSGVVQCGQSGRERRVRLYSVDAPDVVDTRDSGITSSL